MAEGPTEESHPWGFQHEPEAPKVTQTFYDKVKEWFRSDGRLMRALEGIEELLPKLRTLSERGPQDYESNERELRHLIFEAVRVGAQNGSYNEAPKGDSQWTKWMVTVVGMLAVAGIGSAVGMYGKLSAIEANQISQQKQIDYLTQIVVDLTRRPQ